MKSFREVERQFVIMNTPKYVVLTGTTKEANSLLCYGYIDATAGLTYQTVAATMYIDGDFSIVDTAKVISMKIRADSVSCEDIIPVRNKALFRQYSYILFYY